MRAICFVAVLLIAQFSPAASMALTLHVSQEGDDSWSGVTAAPAADRSDGPLRTLEAARDRLRSIRENARLTADGLRVIVHEGEYALAETLTFTTEDGGADKSPVEWIAQPGDKVVITGGRRIPAWTDVTDPKLLERLPEGSRGHVVQAKLRALGVTDFGSPEGGGLMLYCRGRPMTLARWPNDGFTTIADLAGGDPVEIRGTKGDRIGKWVYEGNRPASWAAEPDEWLHGYWFWDWSDQRQKVKAIDSEARTIEVELPYHHYGYRKGQWYYAYNLLCEIDAPGEWYLDRESGEIYFWPPDDDGSDAFVSVVPNLLAFEDVSHMRFGGFRIEGARRQAIRVTGGEFVEITNCTVRDIGGDGIAVQGGRYHVVRGCTLHDLGGGGISLSGGDRATLKSGHHKALDNHIHDYGQWYRMYHAAIHLNGVGLLASGNYIHDAPHMAIEFSGNDHVIENNEIHDVCLESNDAGAMYAGRDWTMRGTVIRNNYLHNITGFRDKGCVGVYLDDMFCGTRIEQNLFFRVTRAAFIGGGRDNTLMGNVFVDCQPALHVDDRALGWAADTVPTTMMERYRAMPVDSPVWHEQYPEMLDILNDDPAAPKGNVVVGNLSVGGRWDEISKGAKSLLQMHDNVVLTDSGLESFPFETEGARPRAMEFAPWLATVEHPDEVRKIDLAGMDRRKN